LVGLHKNAVGGKLEFCPRNHALQGKQIFVVCFVAGKLVQQAGILEFWVSLTKSMTRIIFWCLAAADF
jgi:hypothetical protein